MDTVADNRYKKSIIYYYYDRKGKRIYVGSTIATFKKRKCDHMYDFQAYMGNKNNKLIRGYRSSFDIIIQEDYETGILENYSCENKRQLEHRESEWILAFKEKDIEVVNRHQPNVNTIPVLPHHFFPLPPLSNPPAS